MSDLRKAAEMALEALEALWDILDDIDTASDMAKENDAWYRKRVEALQKKRWDTMITTDGHKLKGGPVEALRQALDDKPAVKTYAGGKPNYCTPVDAVNTSQERVDETAKGEHEPVGYVTDSGMSAVFIRGINLEDDTPLYTAPPQKEWVGLTDEQLHKIIRSGEYDSMEEFARAIEAKLKEKNT